LVEDAIAQLLAKRHQLYLLRQLLLHARPLLGH